MASVFIATFNPFSTKQKVLIQFFWDHQRSLFVFALKLSIQICTLQLILVALKQLVF